MKKDIKRLLLGLCLGLLSAQSIVASDSDDGWPSDDENSTPADSFNMAEAARDLASALSGGRPGQPVQQPAQQQNGAAGFQALRQKMQNLLQPQQAAQPAAQPVAHQGVAGSRNVSAVSQQSAAQSGVPIPPPLPPSTQSLGLKKQPGTTQIEVHIGMPAQQTKSALRNSTGLVLDQKLLGQRRRAIRLGSDSSEVSDWTDSESGTPVTPYAPSRGFSGDALPSIEEYNEGGSTSESPVSVGSSTDQNGAQPIQAPLDTVFGEPICLSDAQLDAQIDSLADELINAAIQKALRLKRLDAAIWENINALQPKR